MRISLSDEALADFEAGTAELIPSEEVFARMDEKLCKAGVRKTGV
jgi:anti-sigma-K factor RskA